MSVKDSVEQPQGPVKKPKTTKSRNGCLTCKKKRLKCDETKPACINCQKKNIECGGYATKFKWRAFNDSGDSPTISLEEDRKDKKRRHSVTEINELEGEPKKASGDKALRRHLELASLSVTGKSLGDIKRDNELIAKGINPETYRNKRFDSYTSEKNLEALTGMSPSDFRRNSNVMRSVNNSPKASISSAGSSPPIHRSYSTNTTSLELNAFRKEVSKSHENALDSLADAAIGEMKTRSPSAPSNELYIGTKLSQNSPASHSPFSPNLSNVLGARSPSISKKSIMASPMDDKLEGLNLTPSLSALINYAFTGDEYAQFPTGPDNFKVNLDIPLSPLNLSHQNNDPLNFAHMHHQSNSADRNDKKADTNQKIMELSSSTSPITSVDMSPSLYNTHTNGMLIKTSEQDQILQLYSDYTCAIMSIKNGPNENPWRTMVIPLASKYPCLFNSIASMTLFHLAGNTDMASTVDDLRAKGYMYMKKCILQLASGLSKVSENQDVSVDLPADVALTTCLNLAVSESWDTHTSSGIAHLKGAKSMIQKVLALLKDHRLQIATKIREMNESLDEESSADIERLVESKRQDLRGKLVMVDDMEWDRILKVSPDSQEMTNGNGPYPKDDLHKMVKQSSFIIPRSLQFLFNIWIYFEVLAQMTTESNNDDKGIDLVATITSMLQNSHDKKKKESSKKSRRLNTETEGREQQSPSIKSESSYSSDQGAFNFLDEFDVLSHNTDYVDPLLGCAQSLFSIMGKVANLIGKIRKAKRKEVEKGIKTSHNSLSTITLATQLKQQLTDWRPTITAEMVNQAEKGAMSGRFNSTWDISSCIATSEAYRFATLLYLHQAVPEIPSLSSHQLAEKIFILLASIPTSSHTYIVHIFPLLVSSCEAERGEEREWCEVRWNLLSQKMWIGNIDRAVEVVREVWKRKDEYLRRLRNSNLEEHPFNHLPGDDEDRLKNLSSQISGLMAVISDDQNTSSMDDIKGDITSKLHWSSVMKEWGWEVLLG